MCCGARTSTVSDFGELGVGMPSHMFKRVAEGVLKNVYKAWKKQGIQQSRVLCFLTVIKLTF